MQWNVEEGEPLYPPKSISYIINMLMWAHESPRDIYRIVRYFFLDLQEIGLAEGGSPLKADILIAAPLPEREQDELIAMWMLDRGYVKEPIHLLSKYGIVPSEYADVPWVEALIVTLALGEKDAMRSVLRKKCPYSLAK
jgi:hypothetical protein